MARVLGNCTAVCTGAGCTALDMWRVGVKMFHNGYGALMDGTVVNTASTWVVRRAVRQRPCAPYYHLHCCLFSSSLLTEHMIVNDNDGDGDDGDDDGGL